MARFETQDVELRFWSKVLVGDGCWLWTASRLGGPYGGFWKEGRMHAAQRIAWELEHGEVPDGLSVLHRCDTPACVRPSHLFLGTQMVNMQDKLAKGRHRFVLAAPELQQRGERQWKSKLTAATVRELRARAAAGERHADIAAALGVRRSTVSKVVKRVAWAHVG